MRRHFLIAIKLVVISTILLGVVYPLAITILGQLLFPRRANGSLMTSRGHVIGSVLIGQPFAGPGYFHPRPSAAGVGYDAIASGGSNLGPTSRALMDRVRSGVARVTAENPGLKKGDVPVDMVTASGSGLDPDISPANAFAQAARVANSRRQTESQVRSLVECNIAGRQFGILGEPRVNVLQLNRALDAMTGSK
jgi:potassium-transporting ATPase KdpC subunit